MSLIERNTDKKCSTCDFSILSKASGINRTWQQLSLGTRDALSTVLVTYILDLRPWQAVLEEWQHPVLPYGVSLLMIVLTGQPSGQAGLTHSNPAGAGLRMQSKVFLRSFLRSFSGVSGRTTWRLRVAACSGRSLVHEGPLCVECVSAAGVFVVGFSSDGVSHCSGLSKTESGRTEIFSFFSGQLYSFGNFVCTKRKEVIIGWQLDKTKVKIKV